MAETISHFWVCSGTGFSSTLFVCPSRGEAHGSEIASLELYDSRGQRLNEAELEISAGRVGIFELGSFMAEIMPDRGLQHGHLVVRSSEEAQHHVMLRYKGGATSVTVARQSLALRPKEPIFFPIYHQTEREQIVTLVNSSSETLSVSAKLFAGNRSPEMTYEINPMASQLCSIRDDFWSKFTGHDTGVALQQYIRLSVTSTGMGAASLLELCSEEGAITGSIRIIS